jgi:Raf kinase inhibitor-like YbhB/YbcL family protein
MCATTDTRILKAARWPGGTGGALGLLLTVLLLVTACSPAATPTPGQVEAAPTPQAAPATPSAGQPAGAAPSPAATVPPSPNVTFPPSPGGKGIGGDGLTVTSAAFTDGASIPKKYSCDGENVSPPLKWSGAPAQTSSFVLILDDPDAPVGTFTHWVAFDIPSTQTEIPVGAKNVGRAGRNSAGRNAYTGPCPPSGTHRYIFSVYALDVPALNLDEGATRDQVSNAMQGHIVAEGKLMGRYGR